MNISEDVCWKNPRRS